MTWNWKVGSQISGLLSLLPGSLRLLFVTGDGAVMSTVRTQDLALIRSCFSSGRRYWKSQGVSRGQNNRISDIVSTATTSAQCWGQEKIFGKIQVCRENQVLIDFVMHEWTMHYGPGVVTVSYKSCFYSFYIKEDWMIKNWFNISCCGNVFLVFHCNNNNQANV